jgi:hypothetical protein
MMETQARCAGKILPAMFSGNCRGAGKDERDWIKTRADK